MRGRGGGFWSNRIRLWVSSLADFGQISFGDCPCRLRGQFACIANRDFDRGGRLPFPFKIPLDHVPTAFLPDEEVKAF